MDYVIETKNLSKKYSTSFVVNNINMHVPKGKIYGLLGRNGAGKTTAMKMMLQLVQPTSGYIHLFGKDYKENKKHIYSQIGSIIETPGFYENLTAYENLIILSSLRGKVNEDEIIKVLELVSLQEERHKPFSNYSLGMKQRLGIAAAIMHNPKLLILDEPTNGLDPIGISKIRSLLSDLSKNEGTTILISSHVLSEIEQIADIIGVMHEGKLIEEVNMERLHKQSRKYLEFEVSDTLSAKRILKQFYQISDYSIHENNIRVYESNYNSGDINRTLVVNGLQVTKVATCEESLEDYFSNLIGGGNIA
jgi:ABC-2 type transport system ATP-binding protein/bacitracin transport system ATP-binding protein